MIIFDWVQVALIAAPGRELTLRQNPGGKWQATLNFCDLQTSDVGIGTTPTGAMEDLNLNLVTDAADEMAKKGLA